MNAAASSGNYKVSFAPLTREAGLLLSEIVQADFSGATVANDHWLCCTVMRRDGLIGAIIVFEFKADFDAYMTVAVWDPKAASRKLITTLLKTIFKYARRVTVQIDPANSVALQQIWRLGFKYEGYIRRGYDGYKDAVQYGLLPEECPYLMVDGPFRMRVVQPTHEQPIGVQ